MFIPGKNRITRMAEGGGGAGGDPDVAAVAAAAAAAAANANKSWYDSFDADTKGYLQNKGLDKKTPAEAFLEASKFHREAEKFVGAPANEMLRLPKEANDPKWEDVHKRLGKPADKKEYDFSTVKRAGDKALDEALSDTIRSAAWNSNVNKESAVRIAQDVVKYLDGVETATQAVKADKLIVEKAELAKNWGANAAANMVIAQGAAKALGVPPEAIAALEGQVGYAKVMDMMRNIGTKIGEDRFVNSPGGNNSGIMTRDQAVAEKNDLMADQAWKDRYLKGGVEEKRKMLALNTIITAGG